MIARKRDKNDKAYLSATMIANPNLERRGENKY